MDGKMLKYYTDKITDAIHAAEEEAAHANFQASIYRLTDALTEAVSLIHSLAQERS